MNLRKFDSLDSTNTFLKNEALKARLSNGDTVVALRQTGGKGRMGRPFFSDGGIYFSVYLSKNNVLCPFSAVTCAVSVAVAKALNDLSVDISIKWVNDLLYNGKKLCGILCEAVSFPNGMLDGVIVGVGINYFTDTTVFPPELSDIACGITGSFQNQQKLLYSAINNIITYIGEGKNWIDYYRMHSSVIGRKICVYPFSSPSYNATVLDINDDGSLCLLREEGNTTLLTSGEVSVRVI